MQMIFSKYCISSLVLIIPHNFAKRNIYFVTDFSLEVNIVTSGTCDHENIHTSSVKLIFFAFAKLRCIAHIKANLYTPSRLNSRSAATSDRVFSNFSRISTLQPIRQSSLSTHSLCIWACGSLRHSSSTFCFVRLLLSK